MKLIIDCNVFISAALGSKTCQKALDNAFMFHDVYYSAFIFEEIKTTFNKPKLKKIKEFSKQFLQPLLILGTCIEAEPCQTILNDIKDQEYLNVAVFIEADAIVTGNTAHFSEEQYEGVRVFSPRMLADLH